MKTVTRTAISNLKYNKIRNILIGIAIFLTTLLLFTVTTAGYGIITVQFEAVNKIYPNFHVMYRRVSEDVLNQLKHSAEIEKLGCRQDTAILMNGNTEILFTYFDDTAFELNNFNLEKGNLPVKKNEIAISKMTLEDYGMKAGLGDTVNLPYQLLQDGGLSYEAAEEFVISGIIKTASEEETGMTSNICFISKEFMEDNISVEDRSYYAVIRVNGADKMTTDSIIEKGKEIAEKFNILEDDIVDNDSYLLANYVDPAFYSGIIIILLIIIFVGVITIYSIYYVSMINKINEYGKLKALGASKKQLHQIVCREGMLIAFIAIPAGIIAGTLIIHVIMRLLYISPDSKNLMAITMANIIRSKEVNYFIPFTFLMTIGISLFTVYLSLLKPMRLAGRISPIEAMGYQGEDSRQGKIKKGCHEINVYRLTVRNLTRNKKRTIITIVTLGLTGILFMVIAVVMSCADSKEIARNHVLGDFRLAVEARNNDKMHPELEWGNIQQNNPLDDELYNNIMSIDGVKSITKQQMLTIILINDSNEEEWNDNITGLDEEYADIIEDGIVEGNVTYEELKTGSKIIMSKNYLRWFPDWKVGDKITVTIRNGNDAYDHEFEIAAIGDYSYGLVSGAFVLPSSAINKLNNYNVVNSFDIEADKDKLDSIEAALEELIGTSTVLTMVAFQEEAALWKGSLELIERICYIFMLIIGGIGIMNLINTMINSIQIRKKELGVMQAVGMSEKQLLKMLKAEGLFYSIGTLVMSLGIGNIAGYFAFLYAKNEGIFSITKYKYPVTQTIIIAAVVLIVQFLLTYAVSSKFKKHSLIDRIRFSE